VNRSKFLRGEDIEATLLAAGDNNAISKFIAELGRQD
jgi:hypothetical protein